MEQQTLKWLESVPKDKRNLKNMVMVFGENGVPKFIPKHLLKNGVYSIKFIVTAMNLIQLNFVKRIK